MKLTDDRRLDLRRGEKDRLVFDDEVKGLGVRISSTGKKNFLVQFRAQTAARSACRSGCGEA